MGATKSDSFGASVWSRFVVSAGFLLLAAGTISAYLSPASSYEMSIYASTPVVFWIAVVVAILISVGVTFATESARIRPLSAALGTTAVLATVLLPIIRNYHYFGHHDALHHLGSAKDIWAGVINPLDFFYPGMHLLSVALYAVLDVPFERALLLIVPLFVLLYFLVMPILARRLFPESRVFYIAGFSALLLLPVNWLSIHVQPHSSSMAVFFFPLPFWLFLMFYRTGRSEFVGALLLSLCTFVIIHPQIMFTFCIFIASTYLVLYLISRLKLPTGIVNWESNAYTVLTSFLIFLIWTWDTSKLAGEIVQFVIVESSPVGNDIQGAQSSLSLIEVSLAEMFVKLFGVAFLYSVFSGLLALILLFGARKYVFTENRRFPRESAHVLALAGGLSVLLALFVGYLIVSSNRGSQYRVLGVIMILATLLGVLALRKGYELIRSVTVDRDRLRGFGKAAISVFLVMALLHSVIIIYPSPWIYRETMHVTETQMSGYEIIFEHGDEDVEFLDMKAATFKYRKAVYGSATSVEGIGIPAQETYGENGTARGITSVPYHFNDRNMTGMFEDRYLVITDVDTRTHTELYEGVRYSESDFRYLQTTDGINKVVSNGGFTVYFLGPRNASA